MIGTYIAKMTNVNFTNAKIKNVKMFKVFVSMATKLSNRQRFYKNTVTSKQIILLL